MVFIPVWFFFKWIACISTYQVEETNRFVEVQVRFEHLMGLDIFQLFVDWAIRSILKLILDFGCIIGIPNHFGWVSILSMIDHDMQFFGNWHILQSWKQNKWNFRFSRKILCFRGVYYGAAIFIFKERILLSKWYKEQSLQYNNLTYIDLRIFLLYPSKPTFITFLKSHPKIYT